MSNGAAVHVYSGNFVGAMMVGDGSTIALYGCFLKNDTTNVLSGTFVDGSYLEITTRSIDGGTISPISVSEQECDTAPSSSPTNFPTLSDPPTATPPNGCARRGKGEYHTLILLLVTMAYSISFISS